MWGALITQEHLPGGSCFAFGLAFHQHLYPPRQHGDLGLLSRDDLRKVFGDADQMGNFFFKDLHVFTHTSGAELRQLTKSGRLAGLSLSMQPMWRVFARRPLAASLAPAVPFG